MFEQWRAKRAEKTHEKELARWQEQHDAYAEQLKFAQEFDGNASDEIMLGEGEGVFHNVTNVALIEGRVTGGHYEGRSSGVSFPIGSIGGSSP